MHNGLASFGPVERGLLKVASGSFTHQVILRLMTSTNVDAILQGLEPVFIALTSCQRRKTNYFDFRTKYFVPKTKAVDLRVTIERQNFFIVARFILNLC